ncbi:hypothetical protein CVIRNUC_008027 [Coccomyxa viridis]|uniref:Uncharacterized protein n=1 Tax=Coccomyxa viridis TaxID=1274662 RepID=A0AAV1ICA0_9CHLO|nr:hypothetical protein CVIRNUC_008027 [Coccomyxa viridis]
MSVADPFQLIFLSPSAIGCAAPVGHYWYRSLDYLFLQKCRWPQASARFVLSKVAADTVLFTPVYVGSFFAFMNSMHGGGLQDLKEKCAKDFWTTTVIEMVVWPPYQVLNFARVPLRHQLVVMNGGTILDSAFLCWARSQDDWMPRMSPHTAD